MSRRAATVVASLAALALIAAWALAVKRFRPPVSTPESPAATAPPVRPPDGRPAPAAADEPALAEPQPVSAAVAGERVDEPRGEASPQPVTAGEPPPVIAADFPPYLRSVAATGFPPRFENGCKSPTLLLSEMQAEPRDELWASRVERELEAMLGRHPWGFQVTVGCRATICQVTEVGKITKVDPVAEAEWHRYWGDFLRTFRSSPLASEFAPVRFFGGGFPVDSREIVTDHRDIAGYVLTSVGQATPDEPADCSLFQPPDTDSPERPR